MNAHGTETIRTTNNVTTKTKPWRNNPYVHRGRAVGHDDDAMNEGQSWASFNTRSFHYDYWTILWTNWQRATQSTALTKASLPIYEWTRVQTKRQIPTIKMITDYVKLIVQITRIDFKTDELPCCLNWIVLWEPWWDTTKAQRYTD